MEITAGSGVRVVEAAEREEGLVVAHFLRRQRGDSLCGVWYGGEEEEG